MKTTALHHQIINRHTSGSNEKIITISLKIKSNVVAVNSRGVSNYHNKRYWKCRLLGITASEATDIRKSYVCDKWEEEI